MPIASHSEAEAGAILKEQNTTDRTNSQSFGVNHSHFILDNPERALNVLNTGPLMSGSVALLLCTQGGFLEMHGLELVCK